MGLRNYAFVDGFFYIFKDEERIGDFYSFLSSHRLDLVDQPFDFNRTVVLYFCIFLINYEDVS